MMERKKEVKKAKKKETVFERFPAINVHYMYETSQCIKGGIMNDAPGGSSGGIIKHSSFPST